MGSLLFNEETYLIRGAIFEVYTEMGCGFLEPVYQECMELELAMRGIPFSAQRALELRYKNDVLTQKYKPDFICFEKVIIEVKAVREVAPEHRAQVFNYLKATGMRLGLLVNFGRYPKVGIERIIL